VARRLGLATLLLLAVAAQPAAAQQAEGRRTIDVVGDASVTARNDAARLTFAVQLRRRSAGGALRASSRGMRRVIAAVRRTGVADRDIKTEEVSVRRVRPRSRAGRRRTLFEATNAIQVTVRSVASVGRTIDAAVRAGATEVNGPRFFVADPRALYRRALLLAFDDAKAKAQEIAARSGMTLGQPVSIREGGRAVEEEDRPQAREQPAVGAPTPTRPGTSRVDATVAVVFEAS
jgi:uncharacterized protein YggE